MVKLVQCVLSCIDFTKNTFENDLKLYIAIRFYIIVYEWNRIARSLAQVKHYFYV